MLSPPWPSTGRRSWSHARSPTVSIRTARSRRKVTGVDEASLIASCEDYIFVGNERVHAQKPIWQLPNEKTTPPWLFSRAVNGSRDFLAIWRR